MPRKSPVAIFIAASTALLAASCHAGADNNGLGGLKEWDTDQGIEAESTLDEAAKEAKKKAKEEDICIPIGEGENCW